MKKKIIHIYTRSYSSHFPEKNDPNYYFAGWASLQAKEIKKRYPDVEQEIWRLEKETLKIDSKKINGVACKIFPAKDKHINYGIPTRSLVRAIKNETKNNQVIFDFHFQHSIYSIILLFLLRNAPAVIHHHGNIPFRDRAKATNSWLKKIVFFILSKMEEIFLKKIDFCSVISKQEAEYLKKFAGQKNISLEQGRKYFDDFKPLDKLIARKQIGLSGDDKVLMYVGHYYKLKGVDILLDVFNELKKEDPKYELLMIGGVDNEENELFEIVNENNNIRNFGRLPNDQLKNYYSAADVYILYSENSNLVKYGGIGTAPIEAMAYNVPVVSSQLIHYPSDNISKIGEIPQNAKDLKNKIKKVIDNRKSYDPRNEARKYYDFEIILNNNIKEYQRIFREYFEN